MKYGWNIKWPPGSCFKFNLDLWNGTFPCWSTCWVLNLPCYRFSYFCRGDLLNPPCLYLLVVVWLSYFHLTGSKINIAMLVIWCAIHHDNLNSWRRQGVVFPILTPNITISRMWTDLCAPSRYLITRNEINPSGITSRRHVTAYNAHANEWETWVHDEGVIPQTLTWSWSLYPRHATGGWQSFITRQAT
jgi:hypothetical protein